MGQGVNARIAELVAEELGLPRDEVRMMPTSTDKNANTSPTAASSGTDLNGAAAVLATRKIKARLSELADKLFDLPESRWARHTAGLGTEPEITVQWPRETINDPNEGADWPTGIATYHGVVFEDGQVHRAITRSEDQLPGSRERGLSPPHLALGLRALPDPGARVQQTHRPGPGVSLLHAGRGRVRSQRRSRYRRNQGPAHRHAHGPRSPHQRRPRYSARCTGAFVQGMGWVTTEKLDYYKAGFLLSHSPSTYKIPSIQDTPRVVQREAPAQRRQLRERARHQSRGRAAASSRDQRLDCRARRDQGLAALPGPAIRECRFPRRRKKHSAPRCQNASRGGNRR